MIYKSPYDHRVMLGALILAIVFGTLGFVLKWREVKAKSSAFKRDFGVALAWYMLILLSAALMTFLRDGRIFMFLVPLAFVGLLRTVRKMPSVARSEAEEKVAEWKRLREAENSHR